MSIGLAYFLAHQNFIATGTVNSSKILVMQYARVAEAIC